jgi:hypothetical protein
MGKIKTLFGLVCLLFVGLTVGDAGTLKPDSEKVLIEKVAAVYISQIGVRELTGLNDGKEVNMYLASTGFTDNQKQREKTGKGFAWCASFVTWCFIQADPDIVTPRSAWAPSWFVKNIVYAKGKVIIDKPRRADTFGIYHAKEDRIGHIGFVDQWDTGDEYFVSVEGNTNAAGSREGDGVYRKRRLKTAAYKVSRWIKPKPILRPVSPGEVIPS